jgi:hypothetical protein
MSIGEDILATVAATLQIFIKKYWITADTY